MTTEQVLEAKGLTKKAGSKQILKGLDLSMHRGEVVGLLGKNGAGKSTLMDVLLGFALPTGGESRVFGDRSDRMQPATKSRVGFVPQSDELMGPMTGQQHLALTASFYATGTGTSFNDWQRNGRYRWTGGSVPCQVASAKRSPP